jgi:hypothetical protein
METKAAEDLRAPDDAGDATPETVKAAEMFKQQIARSMPKFSEESKRSHRGAPFNGKYRICIGVDGKVSTVAALVSIDWADADIVRAIREGWRYQPRQAPVCFVNTIKIQVTE